MSRLVVVVRDARGPVEGVAVLVKQKWPTYFVAPDGQPGWTGTEERPWDIHTAMQKQTTIKPDSRVFVRGGDYLTRDMRAILRGVPEAPIIIQPYRNERVRFINNGPAGTSSFAFLQAGWYTWLWGIEITTPADRIRNSRYGPAGYGIGNGASEIAAGVGAGCKAVHLTIHDVQQGISWWRQGADAEHYGNVVYFCGGIDPTDPAKTARCHNWYTQPIRGLFENNLTHRSIGHGVHAYGETVGGIVDSKWLQEITWMNGWNVGRFARNILVGGHGPCTALRPQVLDTTAYYPLGVTTGESANVGYTAGAEGAVLEGNWWMGGDAAFNAGPRLTPWTVEDNRVVGRMRDGYSGPIIPNPGALWPNNRWLTAPPTSETWVRVWPSRYEPGRAHVAVVNWPKASTVEVDLAGVLPVGRTFRVWCADDPLGPPIMEAVYEGRPVTFPMTNLPVAQPHGGMAFNRAPTWPEFAAFIVRAAG